MNISIPLGAAADVPKEVSNPEPRRQLLTQVEVTDDYVMLIDNSSLERFITCSRSAEYHLVRSRQLTRSNIALRFGGAIHKALEVIYQYGNSEVVGKRANEILIEEFATIQTPPDDHRTTDRAIDVIAKYRREYPQELFSIYELDGTPLVEKPFAEPLGTVDMFCELEVWNDDGTSSRIQVDRVFVVWTGRIDLVLEWDGELWVMDHKTTQIMGAGFFGDFELSQPAVGYCWTTQKLTGRPVSGLVLNALAVRKPSRTGKETEFKRQRFPYPQWQLSEWEPNTLAIVARFLADYKANFFPMMTKWCFGKYGKCEYHEVCLLPQKDKAKKLYGPDYQKVTWSPLDER